MRPSISIADRTNDVDRFRLLSIRSDVIFNQGSSVRSLPVQCVSIEEIGSEGFIRFE